MSIVASPSSPHSSSSPTSIFASISHDFHHGLQLDIINTSTPAFPTAGTSNVFPPAYESINTPSLAALRAAAGAAHGGAQGQAQGVPEGPAAIRERNQEKQALRDRDRAAANNLARAWAAGPSALVSPPRSFGGAALSVEPKSSSSAYSRDSGGSREDDGSPIPELPSPATTPTNSWVPIALIPSGGSGSSGNSLHSGQSKHSSGISSFSFGRRAILPEGMSVQEALAKCEDPALGWSLQFWITIADPVTQHVFYACPATGQTSWTPPEGVFVVPRQAEGEWWELADTSRKNRSYFYNTLTKKTQWTRPGADHFVIPLGLIQRSTLPPLTSTPAATVAFPIANPAPVNGRAGSPPRTPQTVQFPSSTVDSASTTSLPLLPPSHPANASTIPAAGESRRPSRPTLKTLASLSTVSEVSENRSERSPQTPLRSKTALGLGRWRKASLSKKRAPPPLQTEEPEEEYPDDGYRCRSQCMLGLMEAPLQSPAVEYEGPFSTILESAPTLPSAIPIEAIGGDQKVLPLPPAPLDEPIHVDSGTRRYSGSPPMDGSSLPDVHAFHTEEEFATRYFVTRREGLMRQKVPLERIMSWQSAPLNTPLLLASAPLAKEALAVFKVIQHVMGERDRPVEAARFALDGKARPAIVMDLDPSDQKTIVLEEIRWMLYMAVMNGDFRDEVYCQVIKQLRDNGDHDAVVLGFQLLCVLVNSFGPSKTFENYIKDALLDNVDIKSDGIGIMAKYCLQKLKRFGSHSNRGKALSIGEIEHASDAAFYPSVFGESLERVMDLQKKSYPDLKVPVILPFLADGVLALGGLEAEGIFRIPGDSDTVTDLKGRMDRGHYQLQGIENAHVAAALFKLWLRELDEPIVPPHMYNDALAASRSPEDSAAFVKTLPKYQRRVLLFVVSFLQKFTRENVVERTKMTPNNLALVMAPNILRTTSDSLVTVFTNSSFESKFILQLLEHLDPKTVDPEYVPKHIQVEGVV